MAAAEQEQDLVLKVTLNNIHRFVVSTTLLPRYRCLISILLYVLFIDAGRDSEEELDRRSEV